MPKSKRSKALLLIGIIVFLFVFIFLPVLGHFGRKWGPGNVASIIPTNEWQKFSSSEGRFSVLFPGPPELTNVVVTISNIDILQPCYFVWNRQNEYAVGYGDWPKNLKRLRPEQILDIDEEGVGTEVGKIVYQKDIQFANYPGREFEYAVDGKVKYSGRVRIILVGDRLYYLIVIFWTASPHSVDRDKFFNSFHLE